MTLIESLDTPTLLLDYKKLLANLEEVTLFAKQNNLMFRPHIKTHKSIQIAKMQLDTGAVGITCAKVSEAEVMAGSGIYDILVAYPISSEMKIKRIIVLLQKGVKIKIAVDQYEQLRLIQKVLGHSPYKLEVWIKVNSGLNRCGVEPGLETVQLAKEIMMQKNLKLGGIFTHAGHSYSAQNYDAIMQIGHQEGKAIAESAKECEKVGIPIPIRSVGSTPTYKIAGMVDGINEIRPGNATFFDAIQVGLGVTNIDRCAVSVLASVVGVYKGRLVFDTGSKTLCLDKGAHGNQTVNGFGHVVGHPDLIMDRLSEEHGVSLYETSTSLALTDKVQIIPNHVCTVVNQFEEYVVHRDGEIIDMWKVDARGKTK